MINSSQSLDAVGHSPPTMVDTVHVQRNIERNREKGIRDFYLADHGDGDIRVLGSLTLEDAAEAIKMKMLLRDSNNTSIWLPNSAPPDLPMSIEKVFSRPDILKSVASQYMKWMLKPQGLKMGEVKILCTDLYSTAFHCT